jgi:transposase
MPSYQLISGPERRRRWSEEQKRAVVTAAFAPGAIVTQVARRADVYPGQIYRWRRELSGSLAGTGFAEIVVAAATREERIAPPSGAPIEVELGGVTCLRIPPSTPPELAAAVVRALRR